ncbi:MAG: cell division protein FtsA [Bdellovibrionales bacterium CG12_big_fil_rev_8_21_14_0_65_38_15]|nr:MAG: cell division protein FtsA [Bdellovibrionales bacterium CG22_combo_CG10-13_8_21_14_all_38_13]PIQ56043.1 MAG: cell division protein FtsA [Bdellovibrionales bacterium CG12_big_fil_rev_8_21_14_0_65_38_15]PIR30648.1 MAG: cell division protein FtsA [Bdellovibrionales bacterium CG11_big_fil_rev_8_21_14_0_20_38_13]
MNDKNVIVGLDIGTTKVCTIVGLVHPQANAPDHVEIIGIGTHPSHGLKKGSVVNIEKTVKSIQNSLEEARLMSGVNIDRATIGVAGSHIYSFNSSGVVAVKGHEITQEDVDRVLEAAKAVVIPSDRETIHVIPQEFRVDNTTGIKDPVGMCGVRLEAHVHIVTGSISLIQNLIKCVEATGIQAEHITLQPIASSRSVLSSEEKEMGVVLVDIGGGTTDIAIWKDGSLVHSQIIPVGGNHFTNDLAVALKIPHAEAERIKINHGSVLAEKLNQSAHITVQGLSGTKSREVQLSLIAQVLGARAEELFGIIKNVLDEKGYNHDITGGVVLTGGGALIKGLQELGEYIVERPTKIGYPAPFGGMTNLMQNPKFSTVLGLMLESKERNSFNFKQPVVVENQSDLIGRLSDSLKSVFKEIF